MTNGYKVLRPPLAKTFQLPSHKELLKLKTGDLVKVIFQVGNDSPERMWVILKDCSDTDVWTGMVDNDADQPNTAKVLPADKVVSFHPLDIIQLPHKSWFR